LHTTRAHQIHVSTYSFHDAAATDLYALSLHDALPILKPWVMSWAMPRPATMRTSVAMIGWMSRIATRTPFQRPHRSPTARAATRSEEHTSELQSRENLVCRLLLEKKK